MSEKEPTAEQIIGRKLAELIEQTEMRGQCSCDLYSKFAQCTDLQAGLLLRETAQALHARGVRETPGEPKTIELVAQVVAGVVRRWRENNAGEPELRPDSLGFDEALRILVLRINEGLERLAGHSLAKPDLPTDDDAPGLDSIQGFHPATPTP